MSDLPSGTVTFLFTDIEGSTALWERDRAAMAQAFDRHLHLLRSGIDEKDGVLYKIVGDAIQAAFPTAPAAVAAAVDVQRALLAEDWGEIGELRVRMALHAGEAKPDERGDYFAAPLNRLARLLAAGHGGQILLTQAVQQLIRGALPTHVELRDLGEHRLRDLLEPERVFQLLHPDLPAEFPLLKSLENRLHNLPLQPTAFLGREREVAEIVALMRRPDVRLLTLTGTGGTGKTRLALQAAATLLEDFTDGVYFVPLAALTDPALVLSSIASALGIRDEGGSPLVTQLRDVLETKQLLVVLDNMEHLMHAAPGLSELLTESPSVKALVTSRVPLRLRAEREYPVSPLGLPDRQCRPPLEQLTQYDAVRLFIERAQAVNPAFMVDNENAPAVAEICHRLDGLPLAIELAAARVRMLPPHALLARLEHRLPLLTTSVRDAPERQRTLRNTIAWSYDLLLPEDQVLFRRLAVFVGCTIDAAEAVTNSGAELDIFGGLERLVEHSLLRQGASRCGEPRFSMLGTIREFAHELLQRHPDEEEAIRKAHASFFAQLAILVRADLSIGVPAAMRQMHEEEDNLRAALAYLLETDGAEMALQVIGGSLSQYWLVAGGQLSEARAWLDRALCQSTEVSAEARAWGLFGVWMVAGQQGDLAEARRAALEEHDLARQAGHHLLTVKSLQQLGLLAQARGDLEEALALVTEALGLARTLTDRDEPGWSLNILGQVLFGRGDVAAATSALEEAAQVFRATGGVWSVAETLTMLGEIARSEGAYDQALSRHAEALRLRMDSGEPGLAYVNLVEVAGIAHALGQSQAAARLLGAENTYRHAIGHASGWLMRREPVWQVLREALGDASYRQAAVAGGELSTDQAIAEALALAEELASQASSGIRRAE